VPSSLILALRGILVFGERLGGEAKGEREWVAPGSGTKGALPSPGTGRWTEQKKKSQPPSSPLLPLMFFPLLL